MTSAPPTLICDAGVNTSTTRDPAGSVTSPEASLMSSLYVVLVA
ncbi:hypothetical protein [Dermacoccus abyssi]|nr:hypothetical protein [Dermacoccus abyssi]